MKIKLKPVNPKAPLHALLQERSSCRDFQDKTLELDTLGDLLWATCGKKFDAVTSASRTIPSAGATNPLELYVLIGKGGVTSLKEGLYHYLIEEHALELTTEGDRRQELAAACLGQDFLKDAPASVIICAQFERTSRRYGERGERYVFMEVGSACQNAYLAAAELGLGTVAVGAFVDEGVGSVLDLEEDVVPLLVMPIGYPK
ncbi:MAG: SagB/ThcOx family dehydrogenase [Candidatus Omnitrophota bacterium]